MAPTINNHPTFTDLAAQFAGGDKRKAVGIAIASPEVDAFICAYQDGWIGVEGKFARVVARALSAI